MLMELHKSTKVRAHWSEFLDSIIRDKPKMIKRYRDYILILNSKLFKELVKNYTFTVNLFNEDDKTVTASLNEIDIVVNSTNKEQAINMLVKDLIEYSREYFEDFSFWHSAPGRKPHLFYVMNILVQDNEERVRALIKCQPGMI